MCTEFDIIRKYFIRPVAHTKQGIGDDAAIITGSSEKDLVVAVDTLVSGQHFYPDTDPFKLGHKALAVNLSDIAAMGAIPRWATLSLTLPTNLVRQNKTWIDQFSTGFFKLASTYHIDLIGGDTTRGPLAISVQIIGEVEKGKALLRSGAKDGDDIWISGCLGDAALALAHKKQRITLQPVELSQCLVALYIPKARIDLGRHLINLAHSCIDISDGLIADLEHIITLSNVAATINMNDVACSNVLERFLPHPVAVDCLLAGGDDYELCFTVPESRRQAVTELSKKIVIPLTRIGKITKGQGVMVKSLDGSMRTLTTKGYDHFHN